MYLSQFNMLWFYKPGHTITKLNALSRREDHAEGIENDNKGIVVITLDKIRTTILIADDRNIIKQKIFNAMCLLKEADIQRLCKKHSICEECNGILYDSFGYVPEGNILQIEIIQKHHDSLVAGHLGYEKKNSQVVAVQLLLAWNGHFTSLDVMHARDSRDLIGPQQATSNPSLSWIPHGNTYQLTVMLGLGKDEHRLD